MGKHVTDYKNGILEVGDTISDEHSRQNLSEAKGGYIYKIIYIGPSGGYAAQRVLPSGKPSKRIISGLWSHDPTHYVPGGVSPWN